jgi:hypothetical protein
MSTVAISATMSTNAGLPENMFTTPASRRLDDQASVRVLNLVAELPQ